MDFLTQNFHFILMGHGSFLSGHRNCQITVARAVLELPLHDLKVGIWCAVSVQRINGPMPFSKTLNSKRCVKLILLPFFDVLTKGEELYGHFMQDGTQCGNH